METQPETLGEVLRVRRQELGLSLAEVAEKTRISRAYLRALEEDRPEAFPAQAYRSGFLRTYAQLLGLKVEDLPVCRAPLCEPDPKLVPLGSAESSPSTGKTIFAALASVLLVVTAIVFASFFRMAPERPVVSAGSPAVESTWQTREETIALRATDELDEGEEGALPGDVENSVPSGQATISEALSEASAASVGGLPDMASRSVEASAARKPKTFSVQNEVTVSNVIRLRALGPNRLELILDNRPSQRYELKAESELSWRLRRSALIRVDDPSAVELWFGDERLELGGRSQILLEVRPESGGERS